MNTSDASNLGEASNPIVASQRKELGGFFCAQCLKSGAKEWQGWTFLIVGEFIRARLQDIASKHWRMITRHSRDDASATGKSAHFGGSCQSVNSQAVSKPVDVRHITKNPTKPKPVIK